MAPPGGVNGARMQDEHFPTLLVFLCRPRLRKEAAGPARAAR